MEAGLKPEQWPAFPSVDYADLFCRVDWETVILHRPQAPSLCLFLYRPDFLREFSGRPKIYEGWVFVAEFYRPSQSEPFDPPDEPYILWYDLQDIDLLQREWDKLREQMLVMAKLIL